MKPAPLLIDRPILSSIYIHTHGIQTNMYRIYTHANTKKQAVVKGTPFNTVDPAEMAVENKVSGW